MKTFQKIWKNLGHGVIYKIDFFHAQNVYKRWDQFVRHAERLIGNRG